MASTSAQKSCVQIMSRCASLSVSGSRQLVRRLIEAESLTASAWCASESPNGRNNAREWQRLWLARVICVGGTIIGETRVANINVAAAEAPEPDATE